MTTYTCPMHPEMEQNKPGTCPKCGMRLIIKGSLQENKPNYAPLAIIISLILLTSLLISFTTGFSFTKAVSNFMIGFFLVFSGFKLIDLSGFAKAYTTYDILAKKVHVYGYLYPFLELFFAIAMIVHFQLKMVLIAEIIVMVFSGLGVVMKLAKHEKFQCACLGTLLKVPLTKVTLAEDFGMATLAIILLTIKM